MAEEIFKKELAKMAAGDTMDIVPLLASAIATAQREAAGAVVAAVEGSSLGVFTSGEADELTKARCKGYEEMQRVKNDAARKAAEQFMV